MSDSKNFGIKGIGAKVQYGKRGGFAEYVANAPTDSGTAPAFQFLDNTSNLLRVRGADPVHSSDLTTRLYVDSVVQGLDIKASVTAASASGENISLTGSMPLLVDGVVIDIGQRVLLKDQTNKTENGIYTLGSSGGTYTLVRSTDADNQDVLGNPTSEVSGGMYVFTTDGLTNKSTGWVLSSPPGEVNLGVDEISFTQFSSASATEAGVGLTKNGAVFNVNPDNTTIYANSINQLAVKGNATRGNILVSLGDGTAIWSTISLSDPGSIGTGPGGGAGNPEDPEYALPPTSGGTGITEIDKNQLLVGDVGNKWKALDAGNAGTYLGVNQAGDLEYLDVTELRAGTSSIVKGVNVSSSNNFLRVENSNSGPVTVSSDGTPANVDLMFSTKGTGLIVAKTGYNDYFTANQASITEDAFVTKGYVDQSFGGIDTTRIQNALGTTYVATNQAGFPNRVLIGSNDKTVVEVVGNPNLGQAVSGEKFRITNITNEVRMESVNTTGIGDVDIRFIPQNQGQVFFGNTGSGLVQSEEGYSLRVTGGDSSSTNNAGDLILEGGHSLSGDFSGGNVILRAGPGFGAGLAGKTIVQDSNEDNIIEFNGLLGGANWASISSSPQTGDAGESAVKFGVATESAGSNVSVMLAPKGLGLVRVSSHEQYMIELSNDGNEDALVTKGFLDVAIGGGTISAGIGLSEIANVFSVNIAANTIKVDSSDNLIVSSNNVAGHSLLSTGAPGGEANWGPLPLNNPNAITGVLPLANGGIGVGAISNQDLLVGTATNTLTRLAKGLNGQNLQINNSGNIFWSFTNSLKDSAGAPIINGISSIDAVNNLTVTNAATEFAVEIGAAGADDDISILFATKGDGLLLAKPGYTDLIGSARETIVTKGYVDTAVQFNSDPLIRRRKIVDNWTSIMDIGTPTPNVPGREIYLTRVIMKVETAIVGAENARLMSGGTEIMSFEENDIMEAGTYITDLELELDASNTQITLQFYDNTGGEAMVPSSGDIIITVEYKIV